MSLNLGPGPIDRSETTTSARPVAAGVGRSFGATHYGRYIAGVLTVVAIGTIITVAAGLFRGNFTESVPVTLISDRAGLVMNPDAKVKMRGVQIGQVGSIEPLPDGTAALHLKLDPAQIRYIPDNVTADITSSTVFGAKYVELNAPTNPAAQRIRRGQVISGSGVTVEINTVFQQLTQLLDKIDPPKLNATLQAISRAFNGRGDKIGQSLVDLDEFLTKLEPSLPALNRGLDMLPTVAGAYADAAPDLIRIADNSTFLSRRIVDQQQDLDTALVSVIGLAKTGTDVIGANKEPLANLLHLLVPTTDLLRQYQDSLRCALRGLIPFTKAPPQPESAVLVNVGFEWGAERYRYPSNLPKVAARGGPFCSEVGMPTLKPNEVPPFLVADVGANPAQYGNQGILLNSDGLKQMLFGPIDGPPRNSTQIGMPG